MTRIAHCSLLLALGALVAPLGLRGQDLAAPSALSQPAAAGLATEGLDGPEAAGLGLELPDGDALQDALTLSPEQKDKLKVIRRAGREKRHQHTQKTQALITTLGEQMASKAPESDLQATLDALKAERRAQQADQDAALDQAQAVLSPTQAAQYVLGLRDKMRAGLKRWKAQKDR